MKQNYFFFGLFILLNSLMNGQSYAPVVGAEGTTAIYRDSEVFTAWATGITLVRGPQDIVNPTGALASAGSAENAIDKANGQIVSLGDGGTATLTFNTPIANGSGFDLAVFENSFSDTFLELAFVEVSSDGVNFFRFPAHSQTQTTKQVGGFGNLDATYINNLAGKYKASYGTPFDLEDIDDDVLLDKNSITHVKIIDVVGTINPTYATYDIFGNMVNDPYPTAFASSGFDLDAVGVINQKTLSLSNSANNFDMALYPNPASNSFQISEIGILEVYSVSGSLVLKQELKVKQTPVSIEKLHSGIYMVKLTNEQGSSIQKLIKH
ncbi:putative secreted protein (Por secretion system target) [Mariniflexile fucanivorans]|uniref:Putative secreted protein (Por secretion system target) n=1 Tax=Mariniflexile fucanivorans TaxID=264023 RepID=A0A4R1REV6_9FLAO|nr:T9SS type A sorting domain-containing protein [Mariniflexile fucanivorans]TCL64474.1 putative secreted protein (Por secretion system target) [Mariniflexile fucanivorans]